MICFHEQITKISKKSKTKTETKTKQKTKQNKQTNKKTPFLLSRNTSQLADKSIHIKQVYSDIDYKKSF